ncbi:MAG: hypothetical protein FJ096_11800 [Deltaproteobacteria bacterium]|nr:hypothetical protein [Deltaproteobacteria bacterium]
MLVARSNARPLGPPPPPPAPELAALAATEELADDDAFTLLAPPPAPAPPLPLALFDVADDPLLAIGPTSAPPVPDVSPPPCAVVELDDHATPPCPELALVLDVPSLPAAHAAIAARPRTDAPRAPPVRTSDTIMTQLFTTNRAREPPGTQPRASISRRKSTAHGPDPV